MLDQNDDGTYLVSCFHDYDRMCCVTCQENAVKHLIYNGVSREKWPTFLINVLPTLTKEDVYKEIIAEEQSVNTTNKLLRKILNKLDRMPFID